MTIIVGAGIAGLSVANGLINAGYPGNKILIVEKYGYIGGRIVTGKRPDGSSYEIGAGRFHTSHIRLIRLIHRFGLRNAIKPIDNTVSWKSAGTITPNPFQSIWAAYLPLFRSLPKDILANSTIKDIAIRILGKEHAEQFLLMHPYRAEMEIMRADLALENDIFRSGGFLYLEGGLHQLIQRFADALRARGVTFQTNTEVTNIRRSGNIYKVHVNGAHEETLNASRVILALHASALCTLPLFQRFAPLQYIQMAPLTRIYAQFPNPWIVPHVVSDSLLRHTIPIQPQKGLVMISYTDARDTNAWKGLQGPPLKTKLLAEMRKTFPGSPTPSWVHSYEWTDGCSYWLPGNYDPCEVSRSVLRPLSAYPELYVCGESFSMKQAWMEGALEHAAELIKLIRTNGVCPASCRF